MNPMSERNRTPATNIGTTVFSLALPPQRDYRKQIILYTALAWVFFSAGILFRYLLIPNQVLIAAAGMFFFIFASLVFVLKENLQADDGIPEVWHKSGYASTALMFWGYFNGWERDVGFWALVFYAAEGRSWMPMGMNAPGAEQNWRLALNIIRWLGGSIP